MYKVLLVGLFIVSGTTAAMAQDPVKVDSKHYKVEFENSQVRVLRIKYDPHDKSVMHRHPNAVAIFLSDSNARFNFPKAPAQDIVSKAGEVRWTPAVVHLPENIGDQTFEVILVELKGRAGSAKVARRTPSRNITPDGR